MGQGINTMAVQMLDRSPALLVLSAPEIEYTTWTQSTETWTAWAITPTSDPGEATAMFDAFNDYLVAVGVPDLLGPELVTNGGYDDATGWTLGGEPVPTISTGKLRGAGVGSGDAQTLATETMRSGDSLRVTYTVDSISTGAVAVALAGVAQAPDQPDVGTDSHQQVPAAGADRPPGAGRRRRDRVRGALSAQANCALPRPRAR